MSVYLDWLSLKRHHYNNGKLNSPFLFYHPLKNFKHHYPGRLRRVGRSQNIEKKNSTWIWHPEIEYIHQNLISSKAIFSIVDPKIY